MGVACSGKDTRSEHTGRSACYLADFGNSIGVGFVSSASIALGESHRIRVDRIREMNNDLIR
jgi:hypothetical protein